ncbi:MAG TPA: DEAD/DEAH box helicase [Flavitalea sp.]|nr:DEAD/DEAH box helicase [Flavitalea sp.]
MSTVKSISTLREELLSHEEKSVPARQGSGGDAEQIVVLKQYRFYKQLCIELYEASLTKDDRIKNPLILISPLDLILKTEDSSQLKFFSAVSRFQNNPTTGKGALDLEALKIIFKNPLGLRFFYHNTEFSENIVAGSIQHVVLGSVLHDLSMILSKKEDYYEVNVRISAEGKSYELKDIKVLYDHFLLINDAIYLLGNFHFLKPVHFFKKNPQGLRIHESKYKEFRQNVLGKLEDSIEVIHSYLAPATEEQIHDGNFDKSPEKLIYLSDLGPYVMIEPVMKYGEVEIPVLTKRKIHSTDQRGALFAVERDDKAETHFTGSLLLQHPDFEEQMQTELKYFYLHKDRFLDKDWFLNAFEQWENQGITILGFNKLKDNKLNRSKAKVTIHVTSGTNWFNTEIDVRFGKKRAHLNQLQKSVRNRSKFVQLDDGTLGILPEEWIEKFFKYFTIGELLNETLVTPKINFPEVSKIYEEEVLDNAVKDELAFYTSRFATFENIEDIEIPEGLTGTLREYQKHGLNWLNFLDDFNFGGCLADDMGLGKTLQVIAFILTQRKKVQQNTNLIVAPTSVLFNWQAEVKKFSPSIRVYLIHGSNRIKETDILNDYEIILTSYGTLVSDISYLRGYTFNYVFLDESQNIKNIESQRYQAARLLQSRNKIVITGTPVENNTLDLYGQLSFACPGLLGSKQFFRDIYSIPIDKFKYRKRAIELQQKVRPFILRRTKKQVAKELPEKTEMVIYCEMEEEQRAIYNRYEKEFREFVSSQDEEEIAKNPMHVLRGLTRLRQICNSPALLPDNKSGERVSSKINVLIEQIGSKSNNHKILVFSQFVSMLNLIQNELKIRDIKFEWLTGATKGRERVVNNFQDNQSVRVFLISLKAGGTGLNLTEADYIYLVDPWWNPAVENQAIDRSHRIGQKKNVVAVRLVCPDTIEEKIMKLQESKRELSDRLIQADSSISKTISKSELLSLLSLNNEPN